MKYIISGVLAMSQNIIIIPNQKNITLVGKYIKEIFSQYETFSFDYYQREYVWDEKNVTELLDDLWVQFSKYYKPGHTIDDIKIGENYKAYGLGNIIVHNENNVTNLVDGQQRITSMALLLICLYNIARYYRLEAGKLVEKTKEFILYENDNDKLVYRFNDTDRETCFEELLNDKKVLKGVNETQKNIYAAYKVMEDYLGDYLTYPDDTTVDRTRKIKQDLTKCFIKWIHAGVFIRIEEKESYEDAYDSFVAQNNRGKSLSPLEQIKSFIINEIPNNRDKKVINATWNNFFENLKGKQGNGGKNALIIDLFRSKLANDGNLTPYIFEKVGKDPFRWFMDYCRSNPNFDIETFMKKTFTQYYKVLTKLQNENISSHAFYNKSRSIGNSMNIFLIMSAVLNNDDEKTIEAKIKCISHFSDIFLQLKLLNNLNIRQQDIMAEYVELANLIRNESIQNVKTKLINYYNDYCQAKNISFASGINTTRMALKENDAKFLLQRIELHLQSNNLSEIDKIKKFKELRSNKYYVYCVNNAKCYNDYVEYCRKNNVQIFSNYNDYTINGNDIGNKFLLNKTFAKQDEVYFSNKKNIFANSTKSSQLISNINTFDKKVMEDLKNRYITYVEKIWNIDDLNQY